MPTLRSLVPDVEVLLALAPEELAPILLEVAAQRDHAHADRIPVLLIEMTPDVKRDAVKLLDAPSSAANGNLTATEPAR